MPPRILVEPTKQLFLPMGFEKSRIARTLRKRFDDARFANDLVVGDFEHAIGNLPVFLASVNATRLLPGCLHVIGLVVVCDCTVDAQ